ncbi:MAG: phosphopantetheine-binding protein [Bacillota bacterium]|nr:MAG: acyl carrier protein [Bacillota bacterium]
MSVTVETIRQRAARRRELCRRVKQLIVERLELDMDPDLITDDQALFGRGLELDSIDSLELVVAIQDEFGVAITDDNSEVLLSVNRIVDYVEANLP